MTNRKAFLAAIRENPEDDGPRLVYCDWLEDEGEAERAEFIRVQIAHARTPALVFPGSGLQCNWRLMASNIARWEGNSVGDIRLGDYLQPYQDERWATVIGVGGAYGTFQMSFDLVNPDTVPKLIPLRERASLRERAVDLLDQGALFGYWPTEDFISITWTARGFIENVDGVPWEWFREHADRLLAEHPVRRVRLRGHPSLEKVMVSSHGFSYQFAGRKEHWFQTDYGFRATNNEVWQEMLRGEWPSVREWVLPPEPRPTPNAAEYRDIGAAIQQDVAEWRSADGRHRFGTLQPAGGTIRPLVTESAVREHLGGQQDDVGSDAVRRAIAHAESRVRRFGDAPQLPFTEERRRVILFAANYIRQMRGNPLTGFAPIPHRCRGQSLRCTSNRCRLVLRPGRTVSDE